MYDFDTMLDRRHTNSSKWDGLKRDFGDENLMPFWIADMDFKVFPGIHEALQKRIGEEHTYGYTRYEKDFLDSVIRWNRERHGVKLDADKILPVNGVVTGLAMALLALTAPGDPVVINTPVYTPFYGVVKDMKRKLVCSGLKRDSDKYEIDFADLEEKFKAGAKAYIICSPHNPVGRVWTEEELKAVVALCRKYQVQLISDEIHYDIVFSGHKHHSILSLDEEAIMVTAPSKTFNIAGLKASYITAKNKEKFDKIKHENDALHLYVNLFGLTATIAAYNEGAQWVDELVAYLEENCKFTAAYLMEHCPKIKTYVPESTYLMWLDFSEFGMDQKEIEGLLLEKAGVALNSGAGFGEGYERFMRINVATSRAYLEKGLERICKAFAEK